MSAKDDMVDVGAGVAGESDLPDGLYDEAEGVELRMSSPGPAEPPPIIGYSSPLIEFRPIETHPPRSPPPPHPLRTECL